LHIATGLPNGKLWLPVAINFARGGFIMPRKTFKVSWQDALQQFLFYKRAEGRSQLTLRDYKFHVTNFLSTFLIALARNSSLRSVWNKEW